MAINTLYPAVAINAYLWSRIKAEGILTETSYGGLVPIIPVEDVPDFLTMLDGMPGITQRPPYIVYTWTRINTGQSWFIKTQELAYSIRSADDLKTRQLSNLFEDLFEDYDRAAMRVNSYLWTVGKASHRTFNFKHISVSTLGAPMPKAQEEAANESIITLRVTYSEDNKNTGTS